VRLEIADDLFRVGLSRLLVEEGIGVVRSGHVDAVLVDLEGMELEASSDVPVIALCSSTDEEAVSALEDGAAAVVWRGSEPDAIATVLRASVGGAIVMPSPTASRLLRAERDQRAAEEAGRHAAEALSERELEVLSLVVAGLENDEIAAQLVVTGSTVKNHLARIMAKLGARNRTQAAVIASWMVA
jgi:DNA-binding NarL/FixJ family response regulator